MFNQQEMVGLLPKLLRAIADEIESDTTLAERIVASVDGESSEKQTRRKVAIGFDPFEALRQGSEMALRERLEALEIRTLKAVITQHGLDTTRLAQKWRDKDRLVTFIVERISARAEKGDVFREIGQAAVNQ
jgi:hypothetical protein